MKSFSSTNPAVQNVPPLPWNSCQTKGQESPPPCLKSTRKEKAAQLALFSLAALELCASSKTIPPELLLAVPLTTLALNGIIPIYNRYRSPLRKTTQYAKSARALAAQERLQKTAEIYSQRLGLPDVPEIRVWKGDLDPKKHGPGALDLRKKKYVLFDQKSLETEDISALEGILGHELAHIQQHHTQKQRLLVTLMGPPAIVSPIVFFVLSAFAVSALSQRQAEFQADRIGAALSGNPKTLAHSLKQRDGRPFQNGRLEALKGKLFGADTTRTEKALTALHACAKFSYNMFSYFVSASHPSTERRCERLKTFDHPPKRYKTDSLKFRILDFIPSETRRKGRSPVDAPDRPIRLSESILRPRP
ncbi:MAG: M48 family metalloprotease [Alphaproteobacteria bacterium]|nr:M48 family metalloprotease [Alphaproteobacteria bacterium]